MKNKLIISSTLSFLSICTLAVMYYSPNNSDTLNKEGKSTIPNDLWYQVRSYPDGFDENLFLKRMTEVKDNASNTSQTRAVDLTIPWLAEGPGNIGGKFNVLAKSPITNSTIYAGATNGGLFKSTDDGANWNPIFDDLSYLAIGSMAIDPQNENTLYVGTGDKNFGGGSHIGNGVYKSSDAGTNWTQIGLEQTGIITELVLHPTDQSIIYAATLGNPYEKTTERGVYKSIDGGATWDNILFLSDSSGVMDLIMNPSNPDVLYASGFNRINLPFQSKVSGPESKIYKTTDGGTTWTHLTNGLPNTAESRIGLAISTTNTNTLYSIYVSESTLDVLDVFKSTDAGQNWTPLNATSNGLDSDALGGFGWYFGEIYVNPYNDNHIVVTGVEMYHSNDGGSTWSQNVPDWWTYEVHADKHNVLFLSANSYIIATDGGLYKTIDNGTTWTDIENMAVTQFYHIDVKPDGSGIYGGGAQDNGTMSGNAASFNLWDRLYGGDGFRLTYLKQDADAMYVQTQNGNINYLDAFGGSSDVSPDLSNDRTNWDTPYIINEDESELFVGTSMMSIMQSAPYGWYTPISGDLTKVGLGTATGKISRHTITEIEQATYNSDVLMVGTSDGLVWRGDRTTAWTFTNVTTPTLPNRYVTGLKSSPNANNNFYVCYSGYTVNDYSSYLYMTPDLGQTWVDISGDLPNLTVNDILVVPGQDDNYIFAALDGGVYFTENGGVNWDYVGTGLPFVTARELKLDIPNSKLICGTYSRSMFSYDISWIDNLDADYTGINSNSETELSIYPNPTTEIITIKNGTQGEFKVYNAKGQLVLNYNRKTKSDFILNVSALPKGIYVYELNDAKGKLIKK
jgi:photosystem II stability/assembly factor-like uncharacterized protein